MKVFFVLIYLLLFQHSFSQLVTRGDSLSRVRADIIVTEVIGDEISGKCYLLFSIADKYYLIITKVGKYYKEYYIVDREIVKEKYCRVSKDTIIEHAFDTTGYRTEFLSLNSLDFKYEVADLEPTYFYFRDLNGKKYGESRLTLLIKPVPIKGKIYYHLLDKLVSVIRRNIKGS